MASLDEGVSVDAQGPVDQNYPPFLGAHMANDPAWIPSEEGVSMKEMARLCNCRFEADFTMLASQDIAEGEELLASCGFDEDK